MTESTSNLLQKWQRNPIFKAIEAAGFDPREFDLIDNGAEARISHGRSDAYFIIGGSAPKWVGSYVVGDSSSVPYEIFTWPAMMQRIEFWLHQVRHDIETPDLWADLRNEPELLGPAIDQVENTPFTAAEQKEIAKRLHELAENAKEAHSLSAEQMRLLNEKLDYLISAAGRLGRTDWHNAFVGAIVGYALTVPLPPESAREILMMFLRGIVHAAVIALPGG